MTSLTGQQVSVKATYWIGNEPNVVVESRIFDDSNTQPAIVGLQPGTEPQKVRPSFLERHHVVGFLDLLTS
jgi:hypothetical protein